MSDKIWRTSIALIVGLLIAGAISAQEAETATEPEQETDVQEAGKAVIEEIIVTAQKREQSIQEVGITMNAFSGDLLDSMGVTNSNQLALITPNLTIQSPAGEGGIATIVVRGVGLSDFAPTQTGPVGFYVDEVFAGTNNAQVQTMYDVDRVEVLKGPQGTLYGRNTTGGAINIISRKPSDTPDGYIRLSYGSYQSLKLEGAVGGPLSNTVSARVALIHHQTDGWTENLFTGNSISRQNTSGRIMLNWAPSDAVNLLFSLHGSKTDSDADLYNSNLDTEFYKGYSEYDPVLEVDNLGGSLNLHWDISDAVTFTSITGYENSGQETPGRCRHDGDLHPQHRLPARHEFIQPRAAPERWRRTHPLDRRPVLSPGRERPLAGGRLTRGPG